MSYFVGILIYTIASILFALRVIGDDYRVGRWYDVPLILPWAIIALIWYLVKRIVGVEE